MILDLTDSRHSVRHARGKAVSRFPGPALLPIRV